MYLIFFMIMRVIGVALTGNSPGLQVTSNGFKNNSDIPCEYSCEGKEISPSLSFSGITNEVKSLAIIVHDPDAPVAGGFTHWVLWNIDSMMTTIPDDFKGAGQGTNGSGSGGYKGMCPPSGVNHYHFMVYALDIKLSLDKTTNKAALEKAMQGHILAQGEIVGLYKKMK